MLWKTHIRLVNEILFQLGLPKASHEADRLREGSIQPDKWKDYPHHEGKSGNIKSRLLLSRKQFLENNLGEAYYNLGVALHYIQDGFTTLTSRSQHHYRWEQQIEQSCLTNNLETLVNNAFQNDSERKQEYLNYLKLLSKELRDKNETLQVASMDGSGFSYWHDRKYGKPHVDLNFAYKASLQIAKSILGNKTNNLLQKNLNDILLEYERKLMETEENFVQYIIDSTNKRNKTEKRRKNNGIFQSIKNWYYGLLLRIYESKLNRNLREYEIQKHLETIVEDYMISVKNVVRPHKEWYTVFIPQLDLKIVKNELLTTSDVNKDFGITEKQIKSLVERGQICLYEIQGRLFFKKSEIEKVLSESIV